MWGYFNHKHIKEVWYYCSPEIINKVNKIAKTIPHIKIQSLS
jgi:hypothetical protein